MVVTTHTALITPSALGQGTPSHPCHVPASVWRARPPPSVAATIMVTGLGPDHPTQQGDGSARQWGGTPTHPAPVLLSVRLWAVAPGGHCSGPLAGPARPVLSSLGLVGGGWAGGHTVTIDLELSRSVKLLVPAPE